MTPSDNERMLILIPCCKIKESGGEKSYDAGLAITNHLGPFAESLINCRQELASHLALQPGPDLGFDVPTSIPYLPSFKRYSGNLYSKIDEESWQKLRNCGAVDSVIVSALYGLLTWSERIRSYDCQMDERLPNGLSLWNWWKHKGLGKILTYYIRSNGIGTVHDFLSTTYRKAISDAEKRIRQHAEYVTHSYAGLGSGSNFHRGRDVNGLIRKCCK
jgi:hypothetical protein